MNTRYLTSRMAPANGIYVVWFQPMINRIKAEGPYNDSTLAEEYANRVREQIPQVDCIYLQEGSFLSGSCFENIIAVRTPTPPPYLPGFNPSGGIVTPQSIAVENDDEQLIFQGTDSFYHPWGTKKDKLTPHNDVDNPPKELMKKCSCGSASVGSPKHSDWCDIKESK